MVFGSWGFREVLGGGGCRKLVSLLRNPLNVKGKIDHLGVGASGGRGDEATIRRKQHPSDQDKGQIGIVRTRAPKRKSH